MGSPETFPGRYQRPRQIHPDLTHTFNLLAVTIIFSRKRGALLRRPDTRLARFGPSIPAVGVTLQALGEASVFRVLLYSKLPAEERSSNCMAEASSYYKGQEMHVYDFGAHHRRRKMRRLKLVRNK